MLPIVDAVTTLSLMFLIGLRDAFRAASLRPLPEALRWRGLDHVIHFGARRAYGACAIRSNAWHPIDAAGG
jgi:hypothetical protein